MQPGRLRHWLTFEAKVIEMDSDGAQVATWVPAFEVNPRMPFDVVALSGRELIAAQAVQSKVTSRLVGRYRPGFAASMRAWFQDPDLVDISGAKVYPDAVIYDIQAVIPDPDSRRRSVTLLASSGVNEGG